MPAIADDGDDVNESGVEKSDIKLVMDQAQVSRGKAIKALKANKNDPVDAILALSANKKSRGAWIEERLAGWRTDPDVMAQLAALTSLDLSKYDKDTEEYPCVETRRSFGPGMGDPVKRMLGVCAPVYVCIYMHMYRIFILLSVLTHAQCMAELPVCVHVFTCVCPFFGQSHRKKGISG
jgi:hypothetical protein